MQINVQLTDDDVFKFVVDKTADRQDQPLDLADHKRWPHALAETSTWQLHRWDMFVVDVLVPVDWYEQNMDTYIDGKRQYGSRNMDLRVARFFVRPGFQCPSVTVFERQPSCLSQEDHDRVEKVAIHWFVDQPEYGQMVKWGWTAMRSMRDVLVLAGKFDEKWWEAFERNAEAQGE